MPLDAELAAWMEEALVEQADDGPNADRPASERRTPRASTLSSGCPRQSYYYLTGAPKLPPDLLTAASAETGQALEEKVLRHLEAALSRRFGKPFVFERQVKVETDWFTGTADAWNAEYKIVADSKTTNRDSWDIKRKQGTVGDEYIRQLNLYAYLLGAEAIAIPLRAVGKRASGRDGEGLYLVDVMPPDLAVAKEMERQARAAMASREVGSPPPRAFERTYWLCKSFCGYRDTCWKEV